jgi:hypothetical protein
VLLDLPVLDSLEVSAVVRLVCHRFYKEGVTFKVLRLKLGLVPELGQWLVE